MVTLITDTEECLADNCAERHGEHPWIEKNFFGKAVVVWWRWQRQIDLCNPLLQPVQNNPRLAMQAI